MNVRIRFKAAVQLPDGLVLKMCPKYDDSYQAVIEPPTR